MHASEPVPRLPRSIGRPEARAVMMLARRLLSTSSSAASRVAVSRGSDGVVQVKLSRPEKLNALDMPMFRELRDTAKGLLADSSVRAVVVHGEGRAFCAGLDVKAVCTPLGFRANMDELLHREDGEISNLAQDVGYLWRRIPAPVIAATHGVCLGGGLQIALGADMRISAPGCKFSVMESKWGLVPDMSGTVTMRELVPKDVALELTLTGRIFDGNEALRLGLVTRLAKPDENPLDLALDLARELAARSPDAAAAAKRLMHATFSDDCDEARALAIETQLQRRLLGGWNQGVAVAKGLGFPAVLRPGFADRAAEWGDEADEAAEAQLRDMLDGKDL